MNTNIDGAYLQSVRQKCEVGRSRARSAKSGGHSYASRETKSDMPKICLPLFDLRRRALAEIRRLPGCHNVQEIAINRVIDERANFNWSLCVLSSGTADANTAPRGAVHVQSILRRDYDLLTD